MKLLQKNKKSEKNYNDKLEYLDIIDNLNEEELKNIFEKNLDLFEVNKNKELNKKNFNYLPDSIKEFFLEFKEIKAKDYSFILTLNDDDSYLIEIDGKTFLTIGYEGDDGHGYLMCNQKNVINAVDYEGLDLNNTEIEEKSIYFHIVTSLVINEKIKINKELT